MPMAQHLCAALLVSLFVCSWGAFVPASNPDIRYLGRWSLTHPDVAQADWSGTALVASFSNSNFISAVFENENNMNGVDIILKDSSGGQSFRDWNVSSLVWTQTNLDTSLTYTINIIKRNEPLVGLLQFNGFNLSSSGVMVAPPAPLKNTIEFVGDSITCGFGDLGHVPCDFTPYTQDEYYAWGYLVARALNADVHVEAWSGKGVIRNCCNWPNYTSPDPLPTYFGRTLASIDTNNTWDFSSWIPKALIINLGTNDYSTPPQPPQDLFVNAYVSFIKSILLAYQKAPPKVFLACGPMIGDPCCEYVQSVAKITGSTYINLKGILTYPQDYGCDGHPGMTGHQKMAAIAGPIIATTMGW
eukprot:TRINITY_DN2816_c0_g1_i2.p1 TRINITY_DN2816_c0_g1~~TRINITY_DN2816_c0_g1_i2.p1  ORF type:complete len:358 (-),score=62.51 TRINITY_DN2816_c0_g1_i2:99-1172(-)